MRIIFCIIIIYLTSKTNGQTSQTIQTSQLSPSNQINTTTNPYPCTTDTQCSNNGLCFRNNCNCFSGFSSYPEVKDNYCNYKVKFQYNAFLLELFLGFGAGHYYSGRYLHASLKLVALIFGMFMKEI